MHSVILVTTLLAPLRAFSPTPQNHLRLSPSHFNSIPATALRRLYSRLLDSGDRGGSSGQIKQKRKTTKGKGNKPKAGGPPSKANRRTHPRNAFQGSYDMGKLCASYPALESFLVESLGKTNTRPTIQFSDPASVRALNAALLATDYQIDKWQEYLPAASLCPPVPGRADYIHYIADVLAESAAGRGANQSAEQGTTDSTDESSVHGDGLPTRTGPSIRGLDIGTGASLIYPLIGTQSYQWSFIASDVDASSIEAATQIATANGLLLGVDNHKSSIDIRLQTNRQHILKGILQDQEEIDFCMCNPPFYESREAYQKENARKLRNLAWNKINRGASTNSGTTTEAPTATKAATRTEGSDNFGGGSSELWYPGGEVAFISTMIEESRKLSKQCLWFSTLVSRRDHLPVLQTILRDEKISGVPATKATRVVTMGHGQKISTILFWTFHNREEQHEWCHRRGWEFDS